MLAQGFSGLRFPADLEGRYQQGRADERLRLIRRGAFWVLLLWNAPQTSPGGQVVLHDRVNLSLEACVGPCHGGVDGRAHQATAASFKSISVPNRGCRPWVSVSMTCW